ncbi:putative MATE family efflux protein [Mumia flava]|uniref:Putative MATE family efflux protein n=1 Tax=Mumia flava TaxID=1348852 RepID=A0A0B2B2L9_9ACTN|nr:MATE family efflux transporter [Mumia flava]PJJ57693.1 putative MATE family efflux protein [Mumia flava]
MRLHLDARDREIFRIAVPAFAALVSEPLMLAADTAIVGHLGTTSLAGLAIASTVVQTLVGLCVFLAYGTTASVGRHIGAGDTRGAMLSGMSGVWLAIGIGAAAAVVAAAGASMIVGAFGPTDAVGSEAVSYLVWAAPGIPAMLVVLAATGVLRGMQDLRTPLVVVIAANVVNVALNLVLVYGAGLGIAGAAIGTTIAQLGAAAVLGGIVVRDARRQHAPVRPVRAGVVEAAHAGVALVVRTLTLRAALLIATVVATTLGPDALAAHQVAVTVVSVLVFALDAIAIAGQALTGRSLGAGDIAGTRAATRRMIGWGIASGLLACVGLLVLTPWLPGFFTPDPRVQSLLIGALVVIAVTQPVSGIVFVLDGVLIGAGDGTYLAWAGLVTLAVYAPLAWLVWWLDAGLAWLWIAYAGFMLARMVTLVLRERTDAWLVTGTAR